LDSQLSPGDNGGILQLLGRKFGLYKSLFGVSTVSGVRG